MEGQLETPRAVAALLQRFTEKFAEKQLTSQTSQNVPLTDKVYLSITEAVALTGRTEAFIRRKCQDGSLKAVKDGGWKIRRARLQKL